LEEPILQDLTLEEFIEISDKLDLTGKKYLISILIVDPNDDKDNSSRSYFTILEPQEVYDQASFWRQIWMDFYCSKE